MFIQTEETPNPHVLKFLVGRTVMPHDLTVSLTHGQNLEASPLARRLLDVQGISSVFLGKDFVSVTKFSEEQWPHLKPTILGIISDFAALHQPFYMDQQDHGAQQDHQDPIVRQICELLDQRVRPAVAMDGGDITFEAFQDGILFLNLKGACSNCPSSTITLKSGIENMVKFYIPEVVEVRAV